jgi:hypothetical protein
MRPMSMILLATMLAPAFPQAAGAADLDGPTVVERERTVIEREPPRVVERERIIERYYEPAPVYSAPRAYYDDYYAAPRPYTYAYAYPSYAYYYRPYSGHRYWRWGGPHHRYGWHHRW